MCVLPRLNQNVDGECISDKSRFSYDVLKRQQLSTAMMRDASGNMMPIKWDRARSVLKNALINLRHEHADGF